MERAPNVYDWKNRYPSYDIQYFDKLAMGPQSLKILIFSNVDGKLAQLFRMKNAFRVEPIRFDYAVILGNITNLSPEDKFTQEKQSKSEGEISSMLDYTENLGCKILYIPSEQDPDSLYETNEGKFKKLTVNSNNIHKTSYKLAEGLVIAGIGGYMDNSIGKFKHTSNWYSPDYFSNALRSVVQNVGLEHPNDQLILASYVSPSDYCMTKCNLNKSVEYMKIISEMYSSVPTLAVFHGNRFEERAIIKEKNLNIINPGKLSEGQVAKMEVIKSKGKWHIEEVELHSLT